MVVLHRSSGLINLKTRRIVGGGDGGGPIDVVTGTDRTKSAAAGLMADGVGICVCV